MVCVPGADTVAWILTEDGGLPRALRIFQQWQQTDTLDAGRRWQVADVREGGIEIDQFDQGRGVEARIRLPRHGKNQRSTGGPIVVVGLGPKTLLAQMKPMITPEADHRALRQMKFVQAIQQSPDLSIDITDAGIIAVPQLLFLPGRELPILGNVGVALEFIPTAHGELRCSCWMLIALGDRDAVPVVEVPVALWGTEWQVWFAKTDGEKKGRLLCVE